MPNNITVASFGAFDESAAVEVLAGGTTMVFACSVEFWWLITLVWVVDQLMYMWRYDRC